MGKWKSRTTAGMAATGMLALLALGGCATTPGSGNAGTASESAQPADKIAVSVGPCFGFCPVYTSTIAPDGTVTFNGERHTELLGEKSRVAGQGTYRSVAAALAPYRPADGATVAVECAAAISDTSSFTITWTGANGQKAVATHQRGCSGGPGQALDQILQKLPDQLGIAAWAKQVTRPGTSRG